MGRLFFYLFLIIIPIAIGLFLLFKKLYVDDDSQEINFGSKSEEFGFDTITPAPREHVAYQESQSSLIISAIKRAPKTIMTTILIQLALMLFTGYLSVKNIERLAMAGAAVTNGDYGLAISSLWPMGKDALLEQTRIARGVHKYLDDNGLNNFAYVGYDKKDNRNHAIMENPYSTQDHDDTLKKDDPAYGNFIIGLKASKAQEICQEKYGKYGGDLLSLNGWTLSRNHILAARNVKEYPNIPEWTKDVSKEDSDDYLVLSKNSGAAEYAVKKGINNKENGLYIDGDEFDKAAFRCEITWQDNVR